MSAYDKSHNLYNSYDYTPTTTRPGNEDQSYATFAQPQIPNFTSSQSRSGHVLAVADEVTSNYAPTTAHEQVARDVTGYGLQTPTLMAPSPRDLPELAVSSYSPSQGSNGSKLTIYITSSRDLTTTDPALYCTVMFGGSRCSGVLSKLDYSPETFNYAITTYAPSFNSTGWLDSQVPVQLNMTDEYDHTLRSLTVGSFMYTDALDYRTYNAPPQASRKRKMSPDAELRRSPVKRASTQQLYSRVKEQGIAYSATKSPPASPFLNPNLPGSYAYPGGYDKTMQRHAYQQRAVSYQHPQINPGVSAPPLKGRSPSLAAFNPYTSASQISQSPITTTAPTKSTAQPSASPSSTTPTLIRTSTISPSAVPMGLGAPGNTTQPFNPYAIYPAKASLSIDGDLDSMTEDWTAEEWDAKRRLVVFERSQSGSAITTSFKAVTPEQRVPNSICISCIWWEEKQQCFVTSVDTIYLLEALVAVRFTVEEKNRIRRNLEGFRPLTVSKAKSDSEEFFKLIMSFPNPKPRNIEKDVKVFPWKILAHALKKIISKYSASYSSTAGALPSHHTQLTPTAPSSYGNNNHLEERRPTASPRSATSTTLSNNYTSSMTSTALSPSLKLPSAHSVSGGHVDYHGGVSSAPILAPNQTPWQTPQVATGYPGPLAAASRGSWDYTTYMEPPKTKPEPQTPTQSMHLYSPQVQHQAQSQMLHRRASEQSLPMGAFPDTYRQHPQPPQYQQQHYPQPYGQQSTRP